MKYLIIFYIAFTPFNLLARSTNITNVSDLQKLTSYTSLVVLQKRYLPKTSRAEFNLSFASIINHTFAYLGGVSARIGWFFTEDHSFGLELFGPLEQVSKPVKHELIVKQNIIPYESTVFSYFGGVYYKWSPIFGKLAKNNKKIVYFDTYFQIGVGVGRFGDGISEKDKLQLLSRNKKIASQIDTKLFNAYGITGTMGFGQTFALNKDWAFNWELKWLYTNLSIQNITGQRERTSSVNLGLSLGLNYYFPEAGYR